MGRRPRRRYDLATTTALGAVRREVASALGVLVVLTNLLVAMMVAAGAPAGGAQAGGAPTGIDRALDPFGGDRIVICTGSGLVILDRGGRPIGEEPGGATCPFCLPLIGGLVDIPADIPLAPNGGAIVAAMLAVLERDAAPVVVRDRAKPPTGPPAA